MHSLIADVCAGNNAFVFSQTGMAYCGLRGLKITQIKRQ